ncbi:type II toxin-antitoxin system RelE/ParE family toxin [Streptomyces sp. NPDC008122]|uniref:type II toxin-antitoxin system RelE family toxin n=1 Tax=Streptomyces sp. NPDC008122 TaxID=3364810 RepID=UPI0036EE5C3F
MTAEPRPAYGLSFHPGALTDLRALPRDVRDRALDLIDGVVRARITGPELAYELHEYRKLYLGSGSEWRIVYRLQKAPPSSHHTVEAHIVAVRPRARHEVYDVVRARVNRPRPPTGPRVHAARTIPPQLQSDAPQPATTTPAASSPPWRPADLFTPPMSPADSKGPQR